MNINRIKEIYKLAEQRMEELHIVSFPNTEKPIFMISDAYPGVWLEHLYDSVMYARLKPEKTEYAKNIINLFIDLQRENGQLPCYIFNSNKVPEGTELVGYGQVQECLSFSSVCLMVYELSEDRALLSRSYTAGRRWVEWLKTKRMTRGMGLPEMFVGFDTGHDRSLRLDGLSQRGNYVKDGVLQNAEVLPEGDTAAPIIAVDMAANFYGNLKALSKMAALLGLSEESESLSAEAAQVKRALFEVCFDNADCYFYDVDKNGKMRKIKSSTIFHLFQEGVLDAKEDAELISELYTRHIKNPEEFWTPCPFPSVAYCDAVTTEHESYNCWGYFCQLLIYLRCTVWMDRYGLSRDFDCICERVLSYLTDGFDEVKLGQELDPITGKPTESSEWYSSCMLFYIYAARRLCGKL